jgi:hypothetical protein
VGNTHWLLLIPYYFFGALGTLLLLILLSRMARSRLSLNLLSTMAVLLGIGFVTVPIVTGWLSLEAYSVRRMLVLVGATCFLALVDAIVQPALSLPLDKELQDL